MWLMSWLMVPFNLSSLNSQLAYFLQAKTVSLTFQSVFDCDRIRWDPPKICSTAPKYSPAFFLLHEHVQRLFFTSCVSFSISLSAEPLFFLTWQIEDFFAEYKNVSSYVLFLSLTAWPFEYFLAGPNKATRQDLPGNRSWLQVICLHSSFLRSGCWEDEVNFLIRIKVNK